MKTRTPYTFAGILLVLSMLCASAGRPVPDKSQSSANDGIFVEISDVLGIQFDQPLSGDVNLPGIEVGEVIFNAFNPTGVLWYLNIFYFAPGSIDPVWAGDNIPLYPFPDTLCSTWWFELDPLDVLPPDAIIEGAVLSFVCSDTILTQPPPVLPDDIFYPLSPFVYSVGPNSVNPEADIHTVPPTYEFPPLPPWEWLPPIEPPLCKERGCNIPNLDLSDNDNPPDLPSYAGDANAGAPAATANSFRWLMDRHPDVRDALVGEYGDDGETLRELAVGLSDYMGRDEAGAGVLPQDFVGGKLGLVDVNAVPARVKFQSASSINSIVSPIENSSQVALNLSYGSREIDPMWIYDELCDGEDVEVMLQGAMVDLNGNFYNGSGGDAVRFAHVVTVTGMYKVGDHWGMTYKDDQNQILPGGETHAFTWLTPDNTFGKQDWVLDRFDQRLTAMEPDLSHTPIRPRYYLDYAVSESQDSMPPPPPEAGVCFELGDAPENVTGYPTPPERMAIAGAFPTCVAGGPNLFVRHRIPAAEKHMLFLGAAVDYEVDGNMNLCPIFPPYDNDECFGGEAGLCNPGAFTITAASKIDTCPGAAGLPMTLEHACDFATWGAPPGDDIDIQVSNLTPHPAYLNVLIDFTRDGEWGQIDICPDGTIATEHVLVDWLVPPGFVGKASLLAPPDFPLGSTGGFAWMRVTLSKSAVGSDWDGVADNLDNGETEDYLIRIGAEDWGDAPEIATAYPPATPGAFPTCEGAGPATFIVHNNDFACFGPSSDWERNGNADMCPAGGSNKDECYMDGDAGLTYPGPYQVSGGIVAPCVGSNGETLPGSCEMVIWGPDIDIQVDNFLYDCGPAYVNVLADLNHDGDWADVVNCSGYQQPEHIVKNLMIPNLFTGLLSARNPAPFYMGPDCGPVWFRFMISEQKVGANWQGAGEFEFGETEDYLFVMDSTCADPVYLEYGDAPEDAVAYPGGINGNFPTCLGQNPGDGYYVRHSNSTAFFGPSWDSEFNGNANLCPVFDPYDEDECFDDGDAGLIAPLAYTIGTDSTVSPCAGNAPFALGIPCTYVGWGGNLDIDVTNNLADDVYVNVLMDRNRNGQWGESFPCGAGSLSEHVLVNFPVPGSFSGMLSSLIPPPVYLGPDTGYVWFRFSVTGTTVSADWDGSGEFDVGETEDYLLYVDFCPQRLELNGYILPGVYQADTIIVNGTLDTISMVPTRFQAGSVVIFNNGANIPDSSEMVAENVPCTYPACCTD